VSILQKVFKADRFEAGILLRAAADWFDTKDEGNCTVLAIGYECSTGCPHHDEEVCPEGEQIWHAELKVYYDTGGHGDEEWIGFVPKARLILESDIPEGTAQEAK